VVGVDVDVVFDYVVILFCYFVVVVVFGVVGCVFSCLVDVDDDAEVDVGNGLGVIVWFVSVVEGLVDWICWSVVGMDHIDVIFFEYCECVCGFCT